MKSPGFILAGLWTLSVSLATQLSVWQEQSPPTRSNGVLQAILGDSQKLFANHFVTKADVYLHSGVYPSVFDQAGSARDTHLASEAQVRPSGPPEPETHADHEAEAESHEGEAHPESEGNHACKFLGPPRDWIDAFGRNFYPTTHTHLNEQNSQREILPWLSLAAELNPNEVQTFTLGAYWLRNRMGKVDEAESFLRQGWRANPTSYEILLELGRLKEENRHDFVRARHLFEASLKQWRKTESGKERPDEFALMQITGHLARIEEQDGHFVEAIGYLEELRRLSPNPESIQKQIDELRQKANLNPAP